MSEILMCKACYEIKAGDVTAVVLCEYHAMVDEYIAARDRLEEALPKMYKQSVRHAVFVAELCDEYLDRSGAMLGRIRKAALAKAEPKECVE